MANLSAEEKRCFNCGAEVAKPVFFCPQCGAPFPILSSFTRRLLRASVGSVLAMLAWWGAMTGHILLLSSPQNSLFLVYSLACWAIAILCLVAFYHLSK
jgi:predicted RNA-binding Zn-ribbon protein involved in translation (DUF1610 family)